MESEERRGKYDYPSQDESMRMLREACVKLGLLTAKAEPIETCDMSPCGPFWISKVGSGVKWKGFAPQAEDDYDEALKALESHG